MSPLEPDDLDRLLELLRDRPDQRARLRELVRSEAMNQLAETVRGLAGAQERTEARVEQLAVAQRRTEERLEALAGRVDELTEQMRQLTGRVDELTEQMRQLTGRVDRLTRSVEALTEQVSSLTSHVDWLRGDAIERRYRERPHADLHRIIRRPHTLSPEELDALLEDAVRRGVLTEQETDELRVVDVVVRGRHRDGDGEVYLVVEASVGVGLHDVERARERADLLARTGRDVVAVVGGTWVVPDAARAADAYGVWRVTDGRAVPPTAA